MDIKQALCDEFCGEFINVRKVPAGFAVGTGFDGINGDPIGFYVVGPDAEGRFRVEDSGATVSVLEACGVDLEIGTRAKSFATLLQEYGAEFDENRGDLKTGSLSEAQVPKAALRFMALLLRLQDMLMTTHEQVVSTFKDEAVADIRKAVGERAIVLENEVVADSLAEFPADVVIRAENRAPVAIFFVLSDVRLYEAIMLQMEASYRKKVDCTVVALLEKERSVSNKAASHALNRLALRRYRGDERQAVDAIVKDAIGEIPTLN